MSIPAHASYPTLPKGTVIRQAGAVVQSDPDGLASTVEVYRGYYADMVSLPALKLSTGGSIGRFYRASHPNFSSLLAYGVKITHGVGILDGTLTIEYRGLDPALSFPPPPIYEIEETTGNEPLETHPQWVDKIAGKAEAPLNGAIFVDAAGLSNLAAPSQTGTFDPTTATFKGWVDGSIFTGVEDYLSAGCVFKSTYTSFNLPNVSAVGTFSNPDGPAPGLPSNYDWFFVGVTSEDNSGVYRNTATWKAVPTGDAARIIYGG